MQTQKQNGSAPAAPAAALATSEDAVDRIMAQVELPAMDAFIPRGPNALKKARELAEVLWRASEGGGGLVPEGVTKGKKNPVDAIMAHIIYGQEIGLRPMRALNALYNVKGRWGMYAADMLAMVQGHTLCEYIECEEATADKATWVIKRRGGRKERRVTVSMAQARQAGWTSNPKYESEPDQMLKWRALSRGCSEVFGDILRGMATMEELNDAGIRLEGAEKDVNPRPTPPPAPAKPVEPEEVNPETGEVTRAGVAFDGIVADLRGATRMEDLPHIVTRITAAKQEKAIGDKELEQLTVEYTEAKKRIAALSGGNNGK